jgi:hypothetical protein
VPSAAAQDHAASVGEQARHVSQPRTFGDAGQDGVGEHAAPHFLVVLLRLNFLFKDTD